MHRSHPGRIGPRAVPALAVLAILALAFLSTACSDGEIVGPIAMEDGPASFSEAVQASTASTQLEAFTQTELNTNWEGDRRFPTDGVTSVSSFGRDDVARIGIDSQETAGSMFQRTEGIKTVGDNDFGLAVQVDLYVDPAWADNAVRAGFWVVGDDGDESTTGNQSRDEWFGIIEFVNNEDHEGWRFWDSATGWTLSPHPFSYGEWVTLLIVLDPDNQEYSFSVGGVELGTGPGGETFMREVFLNSFNFGLDPQAGLNSDSYAAHWHAGIEGIDSKEDCRDGAWEDLGFRNQGQCIRFVETGKDSR